MYYLKQQSEKYLKYCRAERRLCEGSVRAYAFDLKKFYEYMQEISGDGEDIPLGNIDKGVLKVYLGHLNGAYKVKTVKRKMACLRGLFSFLEEELAISENPFQGLKIRVKEPYVLPEAMTLEEVRSILQAAYQQPTGASAGVECSVLEFLHLRDIAVLEFLFATGLRVHELCNLTFAEYDMERQDLKILGKGQKERRLYVGNEEILDIMERYLRYSERMGFVSKFIFLNKRGEKLSCQAVRNLVAKYCGLSGIKKHITPHAFRHTFATLLLEEGVDIKYIQQFLGHSSISTTQIYLHISESSARSVLRNKHPREKLFFGESANM